MSIDFSKGDMLSGLKGLSLKGRVQGLLNENYYVVLDLLFSYVSGFINPATGHAYEPVMTKWRNMYSHLTQQLSMF